MLAKARILTVREIRGWVRSPFLAFSFVIRPSCGSSSLRSCQRGILRGLLIGRSQWRVRLLQLPRRGDAIGHAHAPRYQGGFLSVPNRSGGYLDRLLVAPVSRSTIALTKVFGTVLFWAFAISHPARPSHTLRAPRSNLSPVSVIASLAGVFLLAWGFLSFLMVLTFKVRRWTMQLISSVNFPIMLFSRVFYPSSRLPSWMATFTAYNPVSFSADISRTLMFGSGAITSPAVITGFAVLVAFALLFRSCSGTRQEWL